MGVSSPHHWAASKKMANLELGGGGQNWFFVCVNFPSFFVTVFKCQTRRRTLRLLWIEREQSRIVQFRNGGPGLVRAGLHWRSGLDQARQRRPGLVQPCWRVGIHKQQSLSAIYHGKAGSDQHRIRHYTAIQGPVRSRLCWHVFSSLVVFQPRPLGGKRCLFILYHSDVRTGCIVCWQLLRTICSFPKF